MKFWEEEEEEDKILENEILENDSFGKSIDNQKSWKIQSWRSKRKLKSRTGQSSYVARLALNYDDCRYVASIKKSENILWWLYKHISISLLNYDSKQKVYLSEANLGSFRGLQTSNGL